MELDHAEEERKQVTSSASFHFPVNVVTCVCLASSALCLPIVLCDCASQTAQENVSINFELCIFKRNVFIDVIIASCGFKEGQEMRTYNTLDRRAPGTLYNH